MICPHCGKFIDDVRRQAYAGTGKIQDKKYLEMTFKVMSETEKAIAIDWFGDKLWMPKSQLRTLDGGPVGDYDAGEMITIQVSEWIAKEKGLTGDDPPASVDDARAQAEKRLKAHSSKAEAAAAAAAGNQEEDIQF